MKAYILSVCGAVLISALVTLLMPEGRSGKFIGGILRLFCLLAILAPLLAFVRSDLPDLSSSAQSAPDGAFIEYFYGRYAKEQGKMLEKTLEEEFSLSLNVQIGWEIDGYSYHLSEVAVEVENFGMYGEGEHILVISELESRVRALTNLSAEAIEVYG